MQNKTSHEFENEIENTLKQFLIKKLTRKAFAIRIFALLGISFIISLFATTHIGSMAYSDNPIMSSLSLLSPLMLLLSLIGFIITSVLVIRRVQDIAYDVVVWPYALGAVVLSWIPVLGYIVLVTLIILPSNYLTQEKQTLFFKRFA